MGQPQDITIDGLPSAGPATSPVDALGLLALLEHAPDARPSDVEHIAGRHYRFITKLAPMEEPHTRVADGQRSSARGGAQAHMPLVGRASTAVVDVWLDEQGRPLRAIERLSATKGQEGSRITTQFSGYGQPVEIPSLTR